MYGKYIKRLLDFILSLILLPLLLPIILLCGLLIKLEDKGPVFYLSIRLGKNSETFKMIKLRTMKVNARDIRNSDGSTFNSDNDPRLTKVGKFLRKTSMDELPQIFNVLRGEMSFIGPRPDLPEHINYYVGEEIRKLNVLPGISGYNQAFYRNSLKWKDRLRNDIYYVYNISLLLDIKIFLKTISCIIQKKGIYSSSQSNNLSGGNFNCFSLEWDTEYFGIKSARVNLKGNIEEINQEKIINFCKSYNFTTIFNHDNAKSNNEWIGKKTHAFLTDINIQFTKITKGIPDFEDDLTYVQNFCPWDDKIIKIAKSAFLYSRFFNDLSLPEKQALNIYSYWTECAFNKENKFFVITKRSNDVAGFILFSMDAENKSAVIELLAVDEKFRGQKIGMSLISQMEAFTYKNGIDTIKVGTQADNTIAVRFYTAAGFQYSGCNSVYHLWNSTQ